MGTKNKIIVFGGGCFWCTEAVFSQLKGIVSVEPGYTGGTVANPSYEEVCTGRTGHAEVIKIEYDPNQAKLEDLLTVFFATHDSVSLNRQGNDVGTQYRSAIFYTDNRQNKIIQEFIDKLNNKDSPLVVTEVKALDNFYPAESYHKNYYQKNPSNGYCQVVINPKMDKLKDKFHSLLK
ncbi:peptide-methionine (S)-S-oxide reductase MsrA [Patescibacteria group bacterium]|nr:peptide-methionine (S)-S-oxide reductase MsrA [Patescibacteria group bacterium]